MAVDFSAALIDSLKYLYTFNLDMGDSYSDVVEWLAQDAGLDFNTLYYGDEYDEDDEEYYGEDNLPESETKDLDEIMDDALMILTSKHSKEITDTLIALFTEENLVEDILDDFAHGSEMLDALIAVDSFIGSWPNGDKVLDALHNNVLSYIDTISIKAIKLGYLIGHLYYRYIDSPLLSRNNGGLVEGCRVDEDGYVYAIYQYVTDYVIKENYPNLKNAKKLPFEIGIACKFGEFDSELVADFYVYIEKRINTPMIFADEPIDSLVITDTSDKGITKAAKKIAAIMSARIEEAIDIGLSL